MNDNVSAMLKYATKLATTTIADILNDAHTAKPPVPNQELENLFFDLESLKERLSDIIMLASEELVVEKRTNGSNKKILGLQKIVTNAQVGRMHVGCAINHYNMLANGENNKTQ